MMMMMMTSSSSLSSSSQRSQQSYPSRWTTRSRFRSRVTIFVIGFLLGIITMNTRLSPPHGRYFHTATGLLQPNSVSIGSGGSSGSNMQQQQDPERIYFAHQPIRFVTEFARCAKNKRCKLLYWHIQKTGGTYLASRLYKILNRDPKGYKSKEWCCHESFMKHKFRTNVTKYCTTNFGVYEVRPNQYREIVDTCLQQHVEEKDEEKDKDEGLEYMGLMTIREPLQRTISQIHQQCNVHRSSHLTSKEQEICNRCQYVDGDGDGDQEDEGGKDDRSFYDHIANTTNQIYQEMKDMVTIDVDDENSLSTTEADAVLKTQIKKKKYLDLPLLILNNEDMDDFFDGLERHVTQLLSNKQHPTTTTATTKFSSFSMFPKIAGTSANDDDDDDDFVDEGPYHLPTGRTNAQKSEVVTGKNENATTTTTQSIEENKQSSTSPKLCNFAMPSQLMKLHRPSLDIYRWFQQRPQH